MAQHEMHLAIPAAASNVLIMRMAVSGMGMLCGLEVDLIGDLRAVTGECCDCLLGRARVPETLVADAALRDGRLVLTFTAQGVGEGEGQPVDRDIAYGILSTLMPEVFLREDELGIVEIICSMSVAGDEAHE